MEMYLLVEDEPENLEYPSLAIALFSTFTLAYQALTRLELKRADDDVDEETISWRVVPMTIDEMANVQFRLDTGVLLG